MISFFQNFGYNILLFKIGYFDLNMMSTSAAYVSLSSGFEYSSITQAHLIDKKI